MGVYEKRLVAPEQELLLLLQLGIMIDSWTELGGWTAIVAGLCFGIEVGVAISMSEKGRRASYGDSTVLRNS